MLGYLSILDLFQLEVVDEVVMGFSLVMEDIHEDVVLIDEYNRDERRCILLVCLSRAVYVQEVVHINFLGIYLLLRSFGLDKVVVNSNFEDTIINVGNGYGTTVMSDNLIGFDE